MRTVIRVALLIGAVLLPGLISYVYHLRQSSPPPEWIAFVVQDGENIRIDLIRPDGSQPRTVLSHPQLSPAVVWSPDGSTLALIIDRSVYRLRTGDSNGQQLTPDSWEISAAHWSPDGQRLALQAYNTGEEGRDGIYRVGRDGSSLRRVSPEVYHANNPAWAPDSRRVIFDMYLNGQLNIYIVDIDRRILRPLTTGQEAPAINGHFSPDGRHLIYEVRRTDPDTNQIGIVQHILDVETGDSFPLTAGIDQALQMTWSPAGDWLLFTGRHEGQDNIYRIRPDGSDLQPLTDGASVDNTPAWSSDGQWIVFTSYRSGNGDIYRMRADGSDLQQLTDSPARESQPAWSPRIEQDWTPLLLLIPAPVLLAGVIFLRRKSA